MVDRRTLLKIGVPGLALASFLPRMSFAAADTDRRFVFIIQRGAADGLQLLPPLGDPAFGAVRGQFMRSLESAHKLDATFSLNPALKRMADLYGRKQALPVHAVASVYRDRSHFDAQNVLESGAMKAFERDDGWLNRLLGDLPPQDSKAVALAETMPLALRGSNAASNYAPAKDERATPDLLARVGGLYASDTGLASVWRTALETRGLAGAEGAAGNLSAGAQAGALAASLLKPADGARVLMMESTGWDTHTAQEGRVAREAANLDATIGALVDGLGPVWNETMVLIATEFGRTVAINGTRGTDHGTGAAAFVLAGSPIGGKVAADWPGLGAGALYNDRDLKPTSSLEGLVVGSLSRHFDIDPARLARTLYPSHGSIAPVAV